ncbi:MAG TPA: Bcr/CflA family multidrug efflux MFS transporter [bacterium]
MPDDLPQPPLPQAPPPQAPPPQPSTPQAPPPFPSRRRLIPVLGALAAFGPLSIDMYLPSLPAIAAEFAVSAREVQLTLSVFFLGFAGGQILYGPLSDRFGRRPVLLAGIALYIVSSVLCALSPGPGTMVAARLLQALGGSAGAVTVRAVIRDLYEGNRAAQAMSMMVLVTGMAPLVAPLVGGQVLRWLGWRAIFWVLAGFGVLCLAAVAGRVPETNPPERRRPLHLVDMLAGYGRVLIHRRALGGILTGSMGFAGMFAYISSISFVYIELFGVPPELFGFLFGLNVVGLMLGATINGRLVTRVGSGFLLALGAIVQTVAGLALLALAWSGTGGLLGIVVPLFFYVGALNLISANALTRTLQHFPNLAGTASSVFGAAQFGVGALAGLLTAHLHDGTAVPMAAVIAGSALLCLAADRLLGSG